MGKTLDWIYDLAVTNNWKSFKVNMAPGTPQLIGTHPDTAKIMLRSGDYHVIKELLCYYNIIFIIDPKSELIYHPFLPWLGM